MKVLMIHVPSQNPSPNSGPETVPMDHTHHTHLLASPNPCPFPQHWVSIQVLKRVQDVKSIVLYRSVFEHVDLFKLNNSKRNRSYIYIYNYKHFCKKIRVLSFIFSWSLLTSLPLISLRVVSEWALKELWWLLNHLGFLNFNPNSWEPPRSHSQSKGSCLAHALLKRPLIKLNNFYLHVFGYYSVSPWSSHAYIIPVKLWSVSFVFLSSHNTYNNLMSLQFVMCYYITHPTLYKN
jgi:hypothetical protein